MEGESGRITKREKSRMETINNIEDLMRILREKPEWAEAVRNVLLTKALLELPNTLAQFTRGDSGKFPTGQRPAHEDGRRYRPTERRPSRTANRREPAEGRPSRTASGHDHSENHASPNGWRPQPNDRPRLREPRRQKSATDADRAPRGEECGNHSKPTRKPEQLDAIALNANR